MSSISQKLPDNNADDGSLTEDLLHFVAPGSVAEAESRKPKDKDSARVWKCDECGELRGSQLGMEIHASTAHGTRPAKCEIATSNFKFTCGVCAKLFRTERGLAIHATRVHPKDNDEYTDGEESSATNDETSDGASARRTSSQEKNKTTKTTKKRKISAVEDRSSLCDDPIASSPARVEPVQIVPENEDAIPDEQISFEVKSCRFGSTTASTRSCDSTFHLEMDLFRDNKKGRFKINVSDRLAGELINTIKFMTNARRGFAKK